MAAPPPRPEVLLASIHRRVMGSHSDPREAPSRSLLDQAAASLARRFDGAVVELDQKTLADLLQAGHTGTVTKVIRGPASAQPIPRPGTGRPAGDRLSQSRTAGRAPHPGGAELAHPELPGLRG